MGRSEARHIQRSLSKSWVSPGDPLEPPMAPLPEGRPADERGGESKMLKSEIDPRKT